MQLRCGSAPCPACTLFIDLLFPSLEERPQETADCYQACIHRAEKGVEKSLQADDRKHSVLIHTIFPNPKSREHATAITSRVLQKSTETPENMVSDQFAYR